MSTTNNQHNQQCCLCHTDMKEYGNNPYPVMCGCEQEPDHRASFGRSSADADDSRTLLAQDVKRELCKCRCCDVCDQEKVHLVRQVLGPNWSDDHKQISWDNARLLILKSTNRFVKAGMRRSRFFMKQQ